MTNEMYRELMRISRRFGAMLASGVPIFQAMTIIEQETVPQYAEAFAMLRQGIKDRKTLSQGMEQSPELFPAPYRNLVHEGEHMGSLDVTTLFAAEIFSPAIASGRVNSEEDWRGLEEPIALMQFTRQFSALLSTGIMWWGRCLYILEHEAPTPFNGIAKELETQSETQRFEPLSERMGRFPAQFSPFYRAMVRAGEGRGGNLAEIMRHLEELLQEDWRLSQRVGWQDGRQSLIINQGRETLPDWAKLSRQEQTITLTLFCRTLGMLLSSGVSLATALATVSHLFPQQQAEAIAAAGQLTEQAEMIDALLKMEFLPSFLIALLRTSQMGGTLEFALTRAADTLGAEIVAG